METNLKCLYPIRIRNKYTKEWMYVNCRQCSACMINKVNSYCVHLKQELKKYPFAMMVTLTYDNNHLPFMVPCSNYVYRGVYDSFPTEVGYIDDIDISKFESIKPKNFPSENMTGVIFYEDLKNFLKRLRIYYERKLQQKFPWRYHCLCEYGTIGKRPHFHILFFGTSEFGSVIRNAIIENWQMSDWSRLDLEESFKFASEGVTSYLTSYVNSLSCSNEFLLEKGIKPKVTRSKNINYAIGVEISKAFQKCICDGFSRRISERDGFPIRYCDYSKLDNISYCLLPKKYISSCFQVPSGLCKSSYGDFCRIIINTLRKSPTKWENSEYLTNLSYHKYCRLRNRNIGDLSSMMDYALDAWYFRNYYSANVLGFSMMDYERMSKNDYYLTRYNTFVDKPNVRDLRLLFRGLSPVDGVHTQRQMDALEKYVDNYKYKLLPKHLKELVNG